MITNDEKNLINSISLKKIQKAFTPVIKNEIFLKYKNVENIFQGVVCGKIYFSFKNINKSNVYNVFSEEKNILVVKTISKEEISLLHFVSGIIFLEKPDPAILELITELKIVSVLCKNLSVEKEGENEKLLVLGKKLTENEFLTIYATDEERFLCLGRQEIDYPNLDSKFYGSYSLKDIIDISKKIIRECGFSNLKIYSNASSKKDVKDAISFGCDGIGLYSTEQMFFESKNFILLKTLLFSEKHDSAFEALKKNFVEDFKEVFSLLDDKPIYIKLFDALQNNHQKNFSFLYFNEENNGFFSERGLRFAILNPIIYKLQIEALFEAVCSLFQNSVKVDLHLVLPFVTGRKELEYLIYGKENYFDGIINIASNICKFYGYDISPDNISIDSITVPFKIGITVENLYSCFKCDELAKLSQFMFYDVNSLTQLSYGYSKNDSLSFINRYKELDILDENLFGSINDTVKNEITLAKEKALSIRPDIFLGIYGFKSADESDISFCANADMNYILCDIAGICSSIVSLAQFQLNNE